MGSGPLLDESVLDHSAEPLATTRDVAWSRGAQGWSEMRVGFVTVGPSTAGARIGNPGFRFASSGLQLIVECLIGLQVTNEGREVLGDWGDLVVEFLIDMDDAWFSERAAVAVVETQHVVAG